MKQELIKAPESKFTEFVPFGAQDRIKLSIEMVKSLIAVKTKSGKTCSDTDAIKFIAMCSARRLNPFEGDAFLIGYDSNDGPSFSLITAHQAFLKRAELNEEYDGMKSGIIVEREGQLLDLEGDFYLEGDAVLGGWATVFFKKRKQPMHKRIRIQRFKKAYGIWVQDAAGMICKCAEADALRSSFPTMLGGLYMKEEQQLASDVTVVASAPIFTAPVIPVQTEAAPPAPKSLPNTLDLIKALCKKAKITELELLNFAVETGLAAEDAQSLDALTVESLQTLETNWVEVREKIKQSPQPDLVP